jgi:hypothetical protein
MFRLIKESSSGPYVQIQILDYCDCVMGSHTLTYCEWVYIILNPLNAELNPICHLLALLEAHHILHVSRIRVNVHSLTICKCMGSHNTITITRDLYLYIRAWWWLFDESQHVARVVRKYNKYRCVWLTKTCYYCRSCMWLCMSFSSEYKQLTNNFIFSDNHSFIVSITRVKMVFPSNPSWEDPVHYQKLQTYTNVTEGIPFVIL